VPFFRYCGENVAERRGHTTIRRILISGWVPKDTNTQTEYIIFTVYSCYIGSTEAPQYYVQPALPLLLTIRPI